MGVSYGVLDKKQQNIFGRISLSCSICDIEQDNQTHMGTDS